MSGKLDDPRIANGLKRQFELRQKLLDQGVEPLGWKVGFGAPAFLEQLKIKGSLVGFLMENGRLASGAKVAVSGWTKPAVETEIAIFIGRDLASCSGPEEAADAIAGLAPAIELADLGFPPDDPEKILSGNIYHRHVILGACDTSRAGARLDGMVGRITRNGEALAPVTDLEAGTGRLVDTVCHVANTLAAVGETLRAGQVIIGGSIVPPMFTTADDREIRYDLDPLGGLSVKLG